MAPRLLKRPASAAALAWFALLLTVVIATSGDYGIPYDEPIQSAYGEAVLSWYTSGFEDRSALAFAPNLHYYGGLFEGLCAAVNRLSGARDPYATRHLLGGLTGWLAGLLLFLLVRGVTGSTWAGLGAAVLLACCPRWYGHAFNNSKDVPFATAYLASILATWTCVRRDRASWPILIAAGVAMGACLGVRVGGLLVLGYHAAAVLVVRRPLRRAVIEIALPAAVAWVVMLAAWPWAQQAPLSRPFEALRLMSDFTDGQNQHMLLDGLVVRARDIPADYVVRWLVMTTPLPVLLGPVIALIAALLLGLRRPEALSAALRRRDPRVAAAALAGGGIIAPIAYAALSGSVLYDGVRHFLFALPLLAFSTAVGAWLVVRGASRIAGGVAWLVIAAAMWPAAAWTLRSHPNQYVYFNLTVGGLEGADGKFETDYWGNALRQAALWLNENAPAGTHRVRTNGHQASTWHYLDARRFRRGTDSDWDYYISFTRTGSHLEVGGDRQLILAGRPVHRVVVDGVTLAYVFVPR